MSIFNFTNLYRRCQKGFLLLEALVSLCALGFLMGGVASWYLHAITLQRLAHDRLHATTVASSLFGKWQSMRTIPRSGASEHEGFLVTVVGQQDATQHGFYWVKITVTKPPSALVVELVSGLITEGSP